MSQISKRFLRPEIFYELYENFDFLIANLTEKKEIFECFRVLLSKNERFMIAKRIAIFLLFAKGYQIKEISQFIKVSTTTVMRYKKFVDEDADGFQIIVNKMCQTESAGKLFEAIKTMFSFTSNALSARGDMRARARLMGREGFVREKRYRMRPGRI